MNLGWSSSLCWIAHQGKQEVLEGGLWSFCVHGKAHKNSCHSSNTVPAMGMMCTESIVRIVHIEPFHEEFPACLEGTVLKDSLKFLLF